MASGSSLRQGLSFVAIEASIDNQTNQYIFVPSAQKFIEPYTSAQVAELSGTAIAEIKFLAPAGVKQAAPISGETVEVTFSSEPLPGDASTGGTSAGRAFGSVAVSQLIGTLTTPGGGTPGNKDVTLPIGTFALGIAFNPASANQINQITVLGKVSGYSYAPSSPQNFQIVNGILWFTVNPALDAIVTVTITNQGGGMTATIIAALYPATITIEPSLANLTPFPVTPDARGNAPAFLSGYVTSSVGGPAVGARTPDVFKTFNGVVNNVAAAVVWTPALGKKFRVLWLMYTGGGTGGYTVRDGGVDVAFLDLLAHTTIVLPYAFNGYPSTTVNNALGVFNQSGAANNIGVTAAGNED